MISVTLLNKSPRAITPIIHLSILVANRFNVRGLFLSLLILTFNFILIFIPSVATVPKINLLSEAVGNADKPRAAAPVFHPDTDTDDEIDDIRSNGGLLNKYDIIGN